MSLYLANACTFLCWAFNRGIWRFSRYYLLLRAQKTPLSQFVAMVLAYILIATVGIPALKSPVDALLRLIQGFDVVILGLMCYEGAMRIALGPEYESRSRIKS